MRLPAESVDDAASDPAHSSPRLGAPLWEFTSPHRASTAKMLKLTSQRLGTERYAGAICVMDKSSLPVTFARLLLERHQRNLQAGSRDCFAVSSMPPQAFSTAVIAKANRYSALPSDTLFAMAVFQTFRRVGFLI